MSRTASADLAEFVDLAALPEGERWGLVAQASEEMGEAAAREVAEALGLRYDADLNERWEAEHGHRSKPAGRQPRKAQALARSSASPLPSVPIPEIQREPAQLPAKPNAPERRAERLEEEIADLPPAEQAAAREAARRVLARRRPHALGMRAGQDGTLRLGPELGGPVAHTFRIQDAFGTASADFSVEMLTQLLLLARRASGGDIDPSEANAMLAAVEAVRPEDETQGMLAVQMAATHTSAMRMLQKAEASADAEAAQGFGSVAVKLLRTYTAQVEALAKIRRGGEQKVRVEHVHVYQGGQAVVGDVTVNKASGAAAKPSQDVEG